MWGLCHSVEIIHQHHHHFYEVVVDAPNRNKSRCSKRIDPQRTLSRPLSSSSKNDERHKSFTSNFYHSKRACLAGSQKGIEVTARQNPSFDLQKISLQTQQLTHPYQQPPKLSHPPSFSIPHIPRASNQLSSIWTRTQDQSIQKKHHSKHRQSKITMELNLTESLQQSLLKSAPTCKNIPQKAKQGYLNCHQLRQSKMGFHNAAFSQIRKNPENFIQNFEFNLQSQQDSLMTQKEEIMLMSSFKTEKMFDDAKSIVSFESLSQSFVNSKESVIVESSMNNFIPVSVQTELSHSLVYIARQKITHWLTTIRLFQFKHQETALREVHLYSSLVHNITPQTTHLPVLELYRVMVEGKGLERRIYFILEPFEVLLDGEVSNKKGYFRAVPSSLTYFLDQFSEQVLESLTQLSQVRIVIGEPLEIKDFVMVNGRFKLHSLSKFRLASSHSDTRISILAQAQRLKKKLIDSIGSY